MRKSGRLNKNDKYEVGEGKAKQKQNEQIKDEKSTKQNRIRK